MEEEVLREIVKRETLRSLSPVVLIRDYTIDDVKKYVEEKEKSSEKKEA